MATTTIQRPKRLPADLYGCIQFARFWQEECPKAHFSDVADLIYFARRAMSGGVRECNVTGYSAEPARKKFEAKAKELGFRAYWPGLWPSLARGRRQISLPSF